MPKFIGRTGRVRVDQVAALDLEKQGGGICNIKATLISGAIIEIDWAAAYDSEELEGVKELLSSYQKEIEEALNVQN